MLEGVARRIVLRTRTSTICSCNCLNCWKLLQLLADQLGKAIWHDTNRLIPAQPRELATAEDLVVSCGDTLTRARDIDTLHLRTGERLHVTQRSRTPRALGTHWPKSREHIARIFRSRLSLRELRGTKNAFFLRNIRVSARPRRRRRRRRVDESAGSIPAVPRSYSYSHHDHHEPFVRDLCGGQRINRATRNVPSPRGGRACTR